MPLLKHILIITIIKTSTNFPAQRKYTPTTPQTEVSTATVKGKESSTVIAKINTLEAIGVLDPRFSEVQTFFHF